MGTSFPPEHVGRKRCQPNLQQTPTLVPLPDDAWEFAERGRFVDDPSVWWVVLDLWTAEEGRSDLSMEATAREVDGQLHVSITSVHVM